MFEPLFGVSVDGAISALHEATKALRDDFVPRCFPDLTFTSENCIELGFLTVYVLDNLVKNQGHPSWLKHQERVCKGYYVACAKGWAFSDSIFAMLYLPRMEEYNVALAENLPELSQICDSQARFVRTTAIIGDVFARLCEHPDDKRYALVGSSAIGLLQLSTEKLFNSSLR